MTTATLIALEHLELDALRDLIEEAREMADLASDDLDPEAVAGMAIELAAINAAVLTALEPLKVKLRELARIELSVSGTKVIIHGYGSGDAEGDDAEEGPARGKVVVTFPSPAPRVSKTTDIPALRAHMGHAFERYFESKTTYKPKRDLADLVRGQAQADVDSVMGAIDYTDPTPRVGFEYDVSFLTSPTTRSSS
jgi:hypothetical protein